MSIPCSQRDGVWCRVSNKMSCNLYVQIIVLFAGGSLTHCEVAGTPFVAIGVCVFWFVLWPVVGCFAAAGRAAFLLGVSSVCFRAAAASPCVWRCVALCVPAVSDSCGASCSLVTRCVIRAGGSSPSLASKTKENYVHVCIHIYIYIL